MAVLFPNTFFEQGKLNMAANSKNILTALTFFYIV